MPPRDEAERLRTEADTILTRFETVRAALERARSESGDHWEAGGVDLTLETPAGEPIELTVDIDRAPGESAAARYDRAAEIEAELDRRERVTDRFDPLPADPVAYLVLYHLDAVEGNYPRSMAGHLDADRGRVEALCEEMESSGLLERVESGTVKQRRVKAKAADEVRQHHTYYRLSRAGDHLLRYLREPEGKKNVLRHLPDCRRILERRAAEGPGSPRETAGRADLDFEAARHRYRTLARVGLLAHTDGGGGAGGARTRYSATDAAERVLDADG
jgi:predicted transcriptional regulator